MNISIDTENRTITLVDDKEQRKIDLYSKEAFELLSRLWVKVGWNEKYAYTFSWLGRPIIQLPEDMVRMQEVIYKLKPDVIIETGVAHGGSLIYYSSLCKLNGKGKVIGIDIEIREHNRRAIQEHELSEYITLIEGNSTDPQILKDVKERIRPNDTVLVILDSDHSKNHVLAELEAFQDIVTVDSYIVATDGIMFDLYDTPRGNKTWLHDNPIEAVKQFLISHQNFKIETPEWPFNESILETNVSHWPMAWLKKIKK